MLIINGMPIPASFKLDKTVLYTIQLKTQLLHVRLLVIACYTETSRSYYRQQVNNQWDATAPTFYLTQLHGTLEPFALP